MTSHDTHDPKAASLDRLPRLAPDSHRAERVRVRCRTRLGQSPRRKARIAATTGRACRLLAPLAVGGFCVLYVVALVVTTLRLEGVIR